MSNTTEYYNLNALRFSKETFSIDMEKLYLEFLQYLPTTGNILDIGCGSGRDALFFHKKGYHVTAMDNSQELVQLARQNTHLDIQLASFYDLDKIESYDGIWACASLLHCERERLPEVLEKIIQALKENGICYLSFKYGSEDREDNGRSFTDLNELQATQLLKQFPNIALLQQWITTDIRPHKKEYWLNILVKKLPMNSLTPSASFQIQFITDIQQLLATAKATSTYKFALLISLVRLSIEKNQSSSDALKISLTDIAEKFIELYWQQARPYFPLKSPLNRDDAMHYPILKQNMGKQAVVINRILEAQQIAPSLASFKKDKKAWSKLLNTISKTIYTYPLKHLQNSDTTPNEFLYHYHKIDKETITLLPHVAFCLTRFSIFIEEICQKYWIDNIRLFAGNQNKFGDLPNLDEFLFNMDRNNLAQIKPFFHKIQKGCCFYCNQPISINAGEVDHFIPWSLYQYDTAHNFVLADKTCNTRKSNKLAANHFYEKWLRRNAQFQTEITEEMEKYNFLVDRQRSESIAKNYYLQTFKLHEDHGFWQP